MGSLPSSLRFDVTSPPFPASWDATSLPVANVAFSLRDARKAVLKPPHSRRWRDCHASLSRAKRLDCARVHRRFSPWPSIHEWFQNAGGLGLRGLFFERIIIPGKYG